MPLGSGRSGPGPRPAPGHGWPNTARASPWTRRAPYAAELDGCQRDALDGAPGDRDVAQQFLHRARHPWMRGQPHGRRRHYPCSLRHTIGTSAGPRSRPGGRRMGSQPHTLSSEADRAAGRAQRRRPAAQPWSAGSATWPGLGPGRRPRRPGGRQGLVGGLGGPAGAGPSRRVRHPATWSVGMALRLALPGHRAADRDHRNWRWKLHELQPVLPVSMISVGYGIAARTAGAVTRKAPLAGGT